VIAVLDRLPRSRDLTLQCLAVLRVVEQRGIRR
jgi:hypothetical protein